MSKVLASFFVGGIAGVLMFPPLALSQEAPAQEDDDCIVTTWRDERFRTLNAVTEVAYNNENVGTNPKPLEESSCLADFTNIGLDIGNGLPSLSGLFRGAQDRLSSSACDAVRRYTEDLRSELDLTYRAPFDLSVLRTNRSGEFTQSGNNGLERVILDETSRNGRRVLNDARRELPEPDFKRRAQDSSGQRGLDDELR